MARAPRVAYVSLGCRTNRVETDAIAAELQRQGCELASEVSADAVVVNTCAVTGEAEAKARKAIRHALSLPGVRVVVATGCVAALHAGSLAAACPGVEVVVDKKRVAGHIVARLAQAGIASPGTVLSAERDGVARGVTPTGRTRPGVKIQDGCDNRCTYCVVWKARGRARSVAAASVIAAVAAEAAGGAAEVVLSGINVGSYADATVGDLSGLVNAILAATDIGRLRLASIEPPDVSEALLQTIANSAGRVAPFLHICLQSGCDATLRRMGRAYDTALFDQVARNARAAVPEISLGTDLIVGFPGERDADFAESLAFCRDMAFSRMHVFRYSPRPNTPAAAMPDQVDSRVSATRASAMRRLAAEMRRRYAASRVGHSELVVSQGDGRGVTGGLLDARIDADIAAGSLARVRVCDVCDSVLICRSTF